MNTAFPEILPQNPFPLADDRRQALLQERLDGKRQAIDGLLRTTHNSWEQAFYTTLARNFGFHTNATPFETLAVQTPLAYLQKHRNSLFQLTAMLLGQSGLLTAGTAQTDEEQRLLREYLFLQKKFSLAPVDGALWRKSHTPPQALPEVRIRQFAQLIHQSEFLFSRIIEKTDIPSLVLLFTLCPAAEDAAGGLTLPAPLGRNSIDILLINSVIPYKYAYALAHKDTAALYTAIALLEQIPPEDNRIIRQWRLHGILPRSAADTQAMIQCVMRNA